MFVEKLSHPAQPQTIDKEKLDLDPFYWNERKANPVFLPALQSSGTEDRMKRLEPEQELARRVERNLLHS